MRVFSIFPLFQIMHPVIPVHKVTSRNLQRILKEELSSSVEMQRLDMVFAD